MPFKNKLMATAALPFLAIAGYSLPAQALSLDTASAVRSVTAPLAQASQSQPGNLVLVQADDEELLKKKRRKEAREEAEGQDEGQGKRNKRRQQQAEEAQQQNQQADEQQENRKKRRQQQAEEAQQQRDQQAEEQENRKKRRQQQAEEAQQQRDQQAEEQENRKKRRQQQAEEAQQQRDQQAEEQENRKKRRQQQAEEAQQQRDQQAEEQENRKKRRQQQAEEAQQQDEQKAADDAKREKRREQQAEEQNSDRKAKREQASDEQPERQKNRKRNAEDPSKTADTIELPVKNGAAVLDSDKDADRSADANTRDKRRKQRENAETRRPKSDRDAQAGFKRDDKIVIKPVINLKGDPIRDFRGYDGPDGRRVGRKDDARVVFKLDGRVVVRDDDRGRLGRRGDTRYERLDNGRIKEVVVRPDGTKIVTIRNRYGEIIRRSRIDKRDRETVLIFSPELSRGRDRLYLRDAGRDLAPMRLTIPVRDYIIDVSSQPKRDYEDFLMEPPVEQVERVYSVDEVKYSARIRDKVRRIDLDTVNFETGSASISMEEASTLKRVAAAINDILDKDPGETFLIEGHTDAVGSDESNLVLSDERAESVANVLSDVFDIPPENLVTQGYGERFLKIDTDDAERANRRVTIRRITPLVRPVASAE